METKQVPPKKAKGQHCEHVFLICKGVPVRSIRPVGTPDWKANGEVLTAPCPFPRHP